MAPAGATADEAFILPTGVGFIGQNGTDQQPTWLAVPELTP